MMEIWIWSGFGALAFSMVAFDLGVFDRLGRAVSSRAVPVGDTTSWELDQVLRIGLRSARRLAVLVAGSSVVLVGIALIVLPGPALLVIPAGLAILSCEFLWARRCLTRFQALAHRLRRRVKKTRFRFPTRSRLPTRSRSPEHDHSEGSFAVSEADRVVD